MKQRATAVTAWEALFRAQVSVMRRLGADFPIDNISFTEYDVLFTLSRRSDRRLRMRDLNNDILLTQPSVSRLVDRLVGKGFLEKVTDPSDGRGAIVVLTDAGFSAYRQVAVQHVQSITNRVGAVLDPDELAELTRICDKLRGA